ncbi:MAG: xylulokinase [Lentisphaeria bacterium]|jgi:xylulokinase
MAKFLGLDCSTQSITAVILDSNHKTIVYQKSLSYGKFLPEYKSPDGFLIHPDPLIKHSNPLMWASALDLICQTMQDDGVNLAEIAGISGSAQQHGTVYLNKDFLREDWLLKAESLAGAVKALLTRESSPIWMDSSTFADCRRIDAALGGPEQVRLRSGSSATERFAGPQISRFAREDANAYAGTAVIHLVSSFMASLLIGASAPIDHGDGAGMNLLNLSTLQWDAELLAATAPNLDIKLPQLVPSTHIIGEIHPYFCRYGFRKATPVIAWSGDNPNSLIGVGGWKPGTAVISLGTSDTFFAAMDRMATDPEGYGHVFGNPAGGFMSLICFKNGSLAREQIRKQYDLSWQEFDTCAFELTQPGNGGNIMLPYFTPEITPLVLNAGPVFEGNSMFKAQKSAAAAVRALVEAQAMTMRLHSAWQQQKTKKVRVTGGASKSDGICQVLADVFDAGVERLQISDSGAQGAAMRATQGGGAMDWASLSRSFCACDAGKTRKPIPANVAIYNELINDYAALEKSITG